MFAFSGRFQMNLHAAGCLQRIRYRGNVAPRRRTTELFALGDFGHQAAVVHDRRNSVGCCIKHFHRQRTLHDVASLRRIHGVHHVDFSHQFRKVFLREGAGDLGFHLSRLNQFHQVPSDTSCGNPVTSHTDFWAFVRLHGTHGFDERIEGFSVPNPADVADGPSGSLRPRQVGRGRFGSIFNHVTVKAVVGQPLCKTSAGFVDASAGGEDDVRMLGSIQHSALHLSRKRCSES